MVGKTLCNRSKVSTMTTITHKSTFTSIIPTHPSKFFNHTIQPGSSHEVHKPPPLSVKPHLLNARPPPSNVKPPFSNMRPRPFNIKQPPSNTAALNRTLIAAPQLRRSKLFHSGRAEAAENPCSRHLRTHPPRRPSLCRPQRSHHQVRGRQISSRRQKQRWRRPQHSLQPERNRCCSHPRRADHMSFSLGKSLFSSTSQNALKTST